MVEYKRGRGSETEIASRMTWFSKCGTFAVQRHKNHYTKKTYYYALVFDGEKFRMIEHMKRYRMRRGAENAIENYIKAREKKKK